MGWKNPWYNPALLHHRPDGFVNPESHRHAFGDVWRWSWQRIRQRLPKPPSMGYPAFITQWWRQTRFDEAQSQQDAVWWLGHASLLLRIDGCFLLTDPVFSQRASPVSFAGARRKTPLPFICSDLPQLYGVLISHNHYDHLDSTTIIHLVQRFPELIFFVPLGLKNWFLQRGIVRVYELDWWQQITLAGIQIHCVPAQHWSRRSLWDTNRSLWCGWVLESEQTRFWFSGDTGYSESLLQIPQRLGPLTAAAIPIGAYLPRWFMALNHMDPQQAVLLWQQLGRPLTVPIHWGVFELADESLDMPVAELYSALVQQQETGKNFEPCPIGGYLSLQR